MKTQDLDLVKAIDKDVLTLKQKILNSEIKIDATTKAIIDMLRVQINELSSIARIVCEA